MITIPPQVNVDPTTVVRLPYDRRRAAAYCDVFPKGAREPFQADSRTRLKAVLAEYLTPQQSIEIKGSSGLDSGEIDKMRKEQDVVRAQFQTDLERFREIKRKQATAAVPGDLPDAAAVPGQRGERSERRASC